MANNYNREVMIVLVVVLVVVEEEEKKKEKIVVLVVEDEEKEKEKIVIVVEGVVVVEDSTELFESNMVKIMPKIWYLNIYRNYKYFQHSILQVRHGI